MDNTPALVNGTPVVTTPQPKKKTSILPDAEGSLSKVANAAADRWLQIPSLILLWIKAKDFKTLAQSYAEQLQQRSSDKNNRPVLSKRLKELDKLFNKSLDYVKGYISDDVSKENAASYYGQFGIQKYNKSFRLPTDRNERLKSLRVLLNGITVRGYGANKYGTAFWSPLVEEYEAKLTILNQMDRDMAGKIQPKQNTKGEVTLVLNALIHLIKGNYPKTYASELRQWGFQKEKY